MIDTNVILDDILGRIPNAETARKISRLITDGAVNGYLSANCLTEVCAEKTTLNYIVTNDKGFLNSADLSIPAISPADFLLKFWE